MAETPEERHSRLVEQAARMRAAQRQKRASHECAPSETDAQLARVERLMARHAPGNVAPIPIATAKEDGKWTVDLHVKIPRVTEYEVSSEGDSLADALARAATALTHQSDLRDRATRNAHAFGFSF